MVNYFYWLLKSESCTQQTMKHGIHINHSKLYQIHQWKWDKSKDTSSDGCLWTSLFKSPDLVFCWHADAFRNSVFTPCLTAMSIAIDITVFQSRQPEIKTCLILVVNIPSITNLVGGLEHEFYDFPFSWEVHHHWRTPSFFSGVGSTTNQKWLELVKQTPWKNLVPGFQITDLQIRWPDVASPKTSRHVALPYITGWWFQTFLFSITHIFQDGYCTTNQIAYVYRWGYCVYFTEIITFGTAFHLLCKICMKSPDIPWLGYPIP